MDPFLVLAVLAAAGVLVWWLLSRRTPPPVEDEWTLPPAESTPAPPSRDVGPQILDREAIVGRDRVLDPSKWDNSPDPPGAGEPDEPEAHSPVVFDRDQLKKPRRPEERPES